MLIDLYCTTKRIFYLYCINSIFDCCLAYTPARLSKTALNFSQTRPYAESYHKLSYHGDVRT